MKRLETILSEYDKAEAEILAITSALTLAKISVPSRPENSSFTTAWRLSTYSIEGVLPNQQAYLAVLRGLKPVAIAVQAKPATTSQAPTATDVAALERECAIYEQNLGLFKVATPRRPAVDASNIAASVTTLRAHLDSLKAIDRLEMARRTQATSAAAQAAQPAPKAQPRNRIELESLQVAAIEKQPGRTITEKTANWVKAGKPI